MRNLVVERRKQGVQLLANWKAELDVVLVPAVAVSSIGIFNERNAVICSF